MKSIIRELNNGKVLPYEQNHIKFEEYEKTLSEIIKIEEELSVRFPEAVELTAKYRRLLVELSNLQLADEFSKGFRIGAQFIIDIYNSTINDYYIAAAELNNGYLDKVENTTYYSDRIQSEITLYYGRVNNKNIVDNISLAVFSKDNKMYLLTFNYNDSSDINGFLAYVESII